MTAKRKIEVFSAGCPVCEKTVELVKRIACDSCDVMVLNLHDEEVAGRANRLGVKSVPAIVIDGKLAQCCQRQGPDEKILRNAGLGQPSA
ncbi:MAG: thioredoxin family protein [Sedimentisphaerales bacterium]|nr:thioredoxin family protein [Sedimentisphaerales bacterium]